MTFNTTPRRRFTDNQRAQFFVDHGGICYLCRGKIHAPQEKWDIEHVIAREIMGDGADDDSNLDLVHQKCHRDKTAADRKAIAKSNRVLVKNLGAHRPKQTISSPGFRKSAPPHTATRKTNKWSLLQ